MIDPQRPGLTLDVDGVPMTFTLDFNAFCAFEDLYQDALGLTAIEAVGMVETGTASARVLRGLVHAGLRINHPDATAEHAGNFLQLGMARIRAAIESSLPDVEDIDAGDEDAEGETAPADPRTATAA